MSVPSIQKFFTSRDNEANSATYVGQQDRLWYDPVTNAIYVSDGNTAGGIMVSGGGSGNGVPAGPANSVQLNAGGGMFGGSANFTYDGSNLTISGNVLPGANNLYNFGSPTLQWASVYISANTLYFDSIPLTAANANALLYNSLPIVSQTANGSIIIPGNVIANNFVQPNGTPVTTAISFVTSNIANLQPGLALNVSAVYGNSTYPGGVFTIYQSANLLPTITVTDTWVSTGTTSKNAYTDFANSVINNSNVSITLSLSSSTFNVQSSDSILIGSANITGANLTGLGISGAGGTYTIPYTLLGNSVQTAATSAVSVSLTSAAGGPIGAVGNTLSTVAPVPFALASITPSWTYPNIVGNVGNSQPINWTYAVTTGTVLSGNIIVTGNANITQASNTALSGSTTNVISTLGNFTVTASIQGNGTFGAGTSTANISAVLPAANVAAGTLTMTDVWTSSGTTNKNQYIDFANSVINTSNVNVTLSLSSGTFNVQASDRILIGSANITGANLTGLGISGSGGTYTIPAAMIGNTVAIALSSAVTANLTTSGGALTATGNTLTTTAPTPFALANVTASWTYPTVIGNVGNSQPINWAYAVTTGTPLAGNIIITGNANITQSSNTATSGATANVISTAGNFIVTASIQGNGLNGAGTTTSNANVTLVAATVGSANLVLYSASTGNSNLPTSWTDASFGNTYQPGPGLPGNSYGILTNYNNPTTQYYWLAIPDSVYWSYGPIVPGNPPLGLNIIYNTFLGWVTTGPDVAYGNGTDTYGGSGGNVTIGGQPYVALGMTGFANIQSPSNPPNLFIITSTTTSG